MALHRFYTQKDTCIANKIIDNTYVRTTGSNYGGNPVLTVFKATGSYPTQSVELAHMLLAFNYRVLSGLVFNDSVIPQSGTQYFLKCFNYMAGNTLPSSYDLNVYPISGTWDEGIGDADIDYGYANWLSASSTNPWVNPGGDYYTTYGSGSQHFDVGDEDLEVDVTQIVQNWLNGTIPANGLLIKLSASQEQNQIDYYQKCFHSRESHIVEKMPYLEARWNDVRKDNRGNFSFNQPNALYYYNIVRGNLQDLPGLPLVRLQDNWIAQSCSYQHTFSASREEQGVYSVAITITSSMPTNFSASWIDIWADSQNHLIMTGSFVPIALTGSANDDYSNWIISPISKRIYRVNESARINVNVRRNNYNRHIPIHTASLDSDTEYMENMYYSVVNNDSGETIIPFGTGSMPYTKLSYGKPGNYFQLDMNSFVPGFTYRVLFLIDYNKYQKDIIDNRFIFKVI